MTPNRYKPIGWRGDSHRHYLAAKGIKTAYHAEKDPLTLSKFGALVQGTSEIALGSQDPTQERSKAYRRAVLEQRTGAEKVSEQELARLKGREKIERTPAEIAMLSAGERVRREAIVSQAREGETEAEKYNRERVARAAINLQEDKARLIAGQQKYLADMKILQDKYRYAAKVAAAEQDPVKKQKLESVAESRRDELNRYQTDQKAYLDQLAKDINALQTRLATAPQKVARVTTAPEEGH